VEKKDKEQEEGQSLGNGEAESTKFVGAIDLSEAIDADIPRERINRRG